MYEEAVEALIRLQESGVRVLFLDRLPARGCRPDSRYEGLERIFSVYSRKEVLDILSRKEEELMVRKDRGILLKARYRENGKNLFFLVNNSREDMTVRYRCRGGRSGELLDPEQGSIVATEAEGTVEIPALRGVFLRF